MEMEQCLYVSTSGQQTGSGRRSDPHREHECSGDPRRPVELAEVDEAAGSGEHRARCTEHVEMLEQ